MLYSLIILYRPYIGNTDKRKQKDKQTDRHRPAYRQTDKALDAEA